MRPQSYSSVAASPVADTQEGMNRVLSGNNPPLKLKRLVLSSLLTDCRLVYPPEILNSTVLDLSPLPVTILMSDTDQVSLTVSLRSPA